MSAKQPGQQLIFQLYMNKDRMAAAKLIRSLERNGFSAIMLTVDAAMPGKRELDQRSQGDFDGPAANGKIESDEGMGIAHVRDSVRGRDNALRLTNVEQTISGYQDPDVCCK